MKYSMLRFTVPVCQYDETNPKAADLDEIFGRKKTATDEDEYDEKDSDEEETASE